MEDWLLIRWRLSLEDEGDTPAGSMAATAGAAARLPGRARVRFW